MNPKKRQRRRKFVNLVALISNAKKRKCTPAADQCAHVNQPNDLVETQLELDGQTLVTIKPKPSDAKADPVEMVKKSSPKLCIENAATYTNKGFTDRGTSTSPTPIETMSTAQSCHELSLPLSVTCQELDDTVNFLINAYKGYESISGRSPDSAVKIEETVNAISQCDAQELGPQHSDEQCAGDDYHKNSISEINTTLKARTCPKNNGDADNSCDDGGNESL